MGRLIALVIALSATGTQVSLAESASNKASERVMDEVSIIGNTELPNVTFNLPWKLPTIQKRKESQPLPLLDNMLVPIDPIKHRQSVFFSQYLELEVPNYKVK